MGVLSDIKRQFGVGHAPALVNKIDRIAGEALSNAFQKLELTQHGTIPPERERGLRTSIIRELARLEIKDLLDEHISPDVPMPSEAPFEVMVRDATLPTPRDGMKFTPVLPKPSGKEGPQWFLIENVQGVEERDGSLFVAGETGECILRFPKETVIGVCSAAEGRNKAWSPEPVERVLESRRFNQVLGYFIKRR